MSINHTSLYQCSKDELIDKIKAGKDESKSFQYLLDNIHGISWEFDLSADKFTYVSSATKKIIGYEKEEWTNFDSWVNMLHPDDKQSAPEYCQTQTQAGKDHVIEYRILKKNGEIIWVLDVISLKKDEEDKPIKLHGFILDITNKKQTELKTKKNHQFLQTIIDSVPDPIMVINSDYTVPLMNKTRKEDIEGRTFIDPASPKCYEISHNRNTPCDGSDHTCPLTHVLENKTETKIIHNHKFSNGEDQFVELAASPLFNDKGECTGIIEAARDMTEHIELTHKLQEQSKQLKHEATHDYLTGLPNRALFMDRLEQAIKDAKRNATNVALFFLDLNNFKEINDLCGHDIGDEVLKEVSNRLTGTVRENDVVSRLGGDEFTIIVKNFHSKDSIITLVKKIESAFDKPMITGSFLLNLSVSIGISLCPNHSKVAEDLLKYADISMYKAKGNAKNTFEFYS